MTRVQFPATESPFSLFHGALRSTQRFVQLIEHRNSSKNIILLWHVDPLLSNDREIINYTTAVTRQRTINNNRETVFSVRSVPKCYKQDKLVERVSEWVSEWVSQLVGELVLGFSCCELLLLKANSWGRGQFGNLEEAERPPLEATTKQRLLKTWLWTLECAQQWIVKCSHALYQRVQ
jgi:hypothetical protein